MAVYHIDPSRFGAVECGSEGVHCDFAPYYEHFSSLEEAQKVSDSFIKFWSKKTLGSKVPQDDGWFTFYVFSPGKIVNGSFDFSMLNNGYAGLPRGARVVSELGPIFQAAFQVPGLQSFIWLKGTDPRSNSRLGKIGDVISFFSVADLLNTYGGRLELTRDMRPVDFPWKKLAEKAKV